MGPSLEHAKDRDQKGGSRIESKKKEKEEAETERVCNIVYQKQKKKIERKKKNEKRTRN